MTKGFVTIATGADNYFITAVNLLKSYRYFTDDPLPFAIIADKENEYTKEFDKTIILKNPHRSYLDKIELLNNIPYDETIYIEADCLAYGNLNYYFDAFSQADDFSIFGRSLPLDTKEPTWFKLDESGKYRSKIKFLQKFHSGIIFLRKGEVCKKIYEICYDVLNNFSDYNIGGNRDALDDKLFAISSSVMNCKMTSKSVNNMSPYCCYPHEKKEKHNPKPCMFQKSLSYISHNGTYVNSILCHWGNESTKRAIYKREITSLNLLMNGNKLLILKKFLYTLMIPISDIKKSSRDTLLTFINKEPIYKFLKSVKHALKK